MQFIILFFSLALYAATNTGIEYESSDVFRQGFGIPKAPEQAFNSGDLSIAEDRLDITDEALNPHIGGAVKFFGQTKSCIQEVGAAYCGTLKNLSELHQEMYEKAVKFAESFEKQFRQDDVGEPLPFFTKIDKIKECFHERFPDSEFAPEWKSSYLSVLLLWACDCMSCALSKKSSEEKTLNNLAYKAFTKEDSFKSRVLSYMYGEDIAQLYKDKEIMPIIPDNQGRISGLEVRYRFVKKGVFSLLNFIACLQQGVLLLTVMQPQQDSHLANVHSNCYSGAGGLLFHDLIHLGFIANSFKNLCQNFHSVDPEKTNTQVFMTLLCDHLSSLPTNLAKVQGLTALFSWIHERAFFVQGNIFSKDFNVFPGLYKEKTFVKKVLLPLKSSNVRRDQGRSSKYAIEELLKVWFQDNIKILAPKLKIFTPKHSDHV